jgi:polyisoprenyl-teichoic acid--peptidoglycan teichoic acid transferase
MPEQPPRLAWGMWKRFGLAALTVVVLTAGATATAGLLQVSTLASRLFPPSSQIRVPGLTAEQAGAPETIMVIGSDKRAKSQGVDRNGPPHSDTLMLVHMDPNQGQTTVLSIPRDLKVKIGGGVQKINAAYTIGGAKLTLATVKALLHIPINHIVDVNFKGFRRAVDAVGCVFVDVDRRYYNPTGTGFATIDIQPGYQRLCGQNALDYVRYRHTDSDFVRVARQQDFIRQFKDQVGVQGILDHAATLERAVGSSIQTDIHGTSQTLTLTKLIAFSLSRPVRQVHFESTPGPSYVTANPFQIASTVRDFENARGPAKAPAHKAAPVSGRRGRRGRHAQLAVPSLGLVTAPRSEQDGAITASIGLAMPIYFPRLQMSVSGPPLNVRRYIIGDESYHSHHAYRIVFSRGLVGEYYGIEGMDWTNPPILRNPTQTVRRGGRTFDQFFDGSALHLVAWHTPHAVYWISNTLLEGLSNAQMMAIAQSAAPVH